MRRIMILGATTPALLDALAKAVKDDKVQILDGGDVIDRDRLSVEKAPIIDVLKAEDPQAENRLERHRKNKEHRHNRKDFEQQMRAKTRRFK